LLSWVSGSCNCSGQIPSIHRAEAVTQAGDGVAFGQDGADGVEGFDCDGWDLEWACLMMTLFSRESRDFANGIK
jgi:hypothetical protein